MAWPGGLAKPNDPGEVSAPRLAVDRPCRPGGQLRDLRNTTTNAAINRTITIASATMPPVHISSRRVLTVTYLRSELGQERTDQPDDAGADDHHEHRRQDAEDQREQQLHWDLHGLFLGQLAPLRAKLFRLPPEHLGDAHTEDVGLDHGQDESLQLVHVGTIRQAA